MLPTPGRLRVAPPALLVLALSATAFAQSPPTGDAAPTPPKPAGVPLPSSPPAASPTPAPGPTPPAATPAPAAGAHGKWKAPAPKLPPPPPPPDVPARLWMIAPGPDEPWTFRIDNEGDHAIRVPADIRLLSFDIEVPSNDPKNPKKKPTTYKCEAPSSLRPDGFPNKRGLLLGPGQSYIETFDPRLFCFGKNAAALVGTAIVRTRFGWAPPPKWAAAAKKASGPYAAEGTDNPPVYTPLTQLTAPTLVLSFGPPVPAIGSTSPAAAPTGTTSPTPAPTGSTSPAAAPTGSTAAPTPPAPPPIVDAMAPRLGVEVPRYTDASRPQSASLTVTVKNAGGRPMLAALRQRMLGFDVTGPDRTVKCYASPPTNAIPREGYREYKAGATTSFTVLLAEVCPDDVFSRPGLYSVKASVWANERGAELGLDAYTGKAAADSPAWLRLASAREPFYKDAPKAVPTPKPAASDDGDEAKPAGEDAMKSSGGTDNTPDKSAGDAGGNTGKKPENDGEKKP